MHEGLGNALVHLAHVEKINLVSSHMLPVLLLRPLYVGLCFQLDLIVGWMHEPVGLEELGGKWLF